MWSPNGVQKVLKSGHWAKPQANPHGRVKNCAGVKPRKTHFFRPFLKNQEKHEKHHFFVVFWPGAKRPFLTVKEAGFREKCPFWHE